MVEKLLTMTPPHLAMFDHASMSYHTVCNRGVSHEFVRHRLFGFAQESTRYCNYNKGKFDSEIRVVQPDFRYDRSTNEWYDLMLRMEAVYRDAIARGESAQVARDNLPICLKTELVITGDFTEWMHFFKLRTDKAAHPQMRQLAGMILKDAVTRVTLVFDRFLKELNNEHNI
jgi:thymidylate synthase (FAD)